MQQHIEDHSYELLGCYKVLEKLLPEEELKQIVVNHIRYKMEELNMTKFGQLIINLFETHKIGVFINKKI